MLLINKTLIKMSKGLWGWILVIAGLKMVTLIGTAVFSRIISGFLGNLTSPSMSASGAGYAVLSAFIAAFVMLISELLAGEAEFRCSARARQSLRTAIFSKILDLDVGNIEKIGPVSAITSSVDGVEAMQIYYSKYMPSLIYCLIAPFYLFGQIRTVSLPCAVTLFIISIVLLPVNNLFRSRIECLKKNYWDSMEDLTGYYLESVRGLTTFKLFGQDGRRTEVLREKADHFNHTVMDVMKVNFSSFLLTDGLIYLSVVLSTVIACSQLAKGAVSFSSALMILLFSYGFFGSVRQLMNATHSALAGVSAAEKVAQLLAIDSSRPYDPGICPEKNPYDGILLEHVSYTYEGRKTALEDISIKIPKGKVTALVGLSGCGKSTTAGLLMRFYDAQSGRILIEGRDSLSFSLKELRRKIIMVPQSVSLFSGTLEENLRIAAPDASREELLSALADVRLGDWVLSLPQGLDTPVGDAGSKLSGGQRQKIGIARALLSQAEYIIFDEATSSVDVDSEQEIWNCIHELAAIRTLIIISHRLSTIRNADCIYVLSGGRVAESGSHDTLMKNDGLYRRLSDEQTALENHGEEAIFHG